MLPDGWQDKINNGCCPVCGKHKNNWTRRTDWINCSKECSKEWGKLTVFDWSVLRKEALKRDNYHCVKCGFQPTYKRFNYTTWDLMIVKELPDEQGVKVWEVVDTMNLIVDHIKPIALGGDEWDINNLQTLCSSCNKLKTARDIKFIAVERRIPIEQVRL
jgi:5-methylcytosine-specific restriction endonuclease McrA